jgi:hypothetical protein
VAGFLPTPTHGDGWFAGARKRARHTDGTIPSNLAIHDLRHTAASLAIFADLDAVATALDRAKQASDGVNSPSKSSGRNTTGYRGLPTFRAF